MTINSKKIRGMMGDQGGAALPEFVVAVFPILMLFFVFVQVAALFIAHLVTHHAAIVAARCAVVDKGPDLPGKYLDADAALACKNAAIAGLGRGLWLQTVVGMNVAITFDGGSGGDDDHTSQYSDVTTTTTATYQCSVPLGKNFVCNNGTRNFTFAIKLPHQGAVYTLDNDYNGT